MEASYATSSSDEDFDNNHVYVHKTSRHHSDKLTTVVSLKGVNVTMEIDTGAELSTIPVALYAEKLSHLPLQLSTISLRQYDGSTLMYFLCGVAPSNWSTIHAQVKINACRFP